MADLTAMDALSALLLPEVLRFLLVLSRVGAALGMLPGFGETVVPMRVRLGAALMVAFVLAPSMPAAPGALQGDGLALVERLACELAIGAFLGLGAKLFLSALQVAGGIAAQAIGLGNPFSMGLGGFEGGSLLSGTLVITGLAVFFATDLHYLSLDALARSYGAWPIGVWPDVGALARRFSELVAATFRLGVGIAVPFLMIAVLGNLVLGLVNRVMPSMPVFFVGTPMLLGGGLFVFMITAGAMVTLALAAMADWLGGS